MDRDTQTRLRNRLRRVHGQVAAIERMVEEDSDCVDILLQLSAVQGALGRVSKILLRHHVESCLVDAVSSGDTGETTARLDELLDIVERHGGFGGR